MTQSKSIILPKCKVVYYNNVKYDNGTKRLVKVTAILEMISLKRGKVISAKFEPLDKQSETALPVNIEHEEIGALKNLVSCYEVETLS